MKIAILLSTYNGAEYLREQIASIINQTNTEWKLYVRDDESKDATINIIKEYVDIYPGKINFVSDSLGNLRSGKSFMQLLKSTDADYYMFADQDDVWLPFKIDITLQKLKSIEDNNKNKPIAIFTDLKITDAALNVINESMWKYSGINPANAKNFYKSTCINSVTGCTMMFNNKLKVKVLPYPDHATMHDRWIALNAVHYGIIDYVDESTILYRQHANNVIGAEEISKKYYKKKLLSLKAIITENIKVIKMLMALNFKVNPIKVVFAKIKIILNK